MITITQKDILDSLAAGVSPEEIAKNFTEALNNAIATRNAEVEKAAKIQKKKDCMSAILDLVDQFIKEFYPDVYDEKICGEVDAEKVIAAFDEAYNDTMRLMRMLGGEAIPTNKIPAREKAMDPIAEFLKSNNL